MTPRRELKEITEESKKNARNLSGYKCPPVAGWKTSTCNRKAMERAAFDLYKLHFDGNRYK